MKVLVLTILFGVLLCSAKELPFFKGESSFGEHCTIQQGKKETIWLRYYVRTYERGNWQTVYSISKDLTHLSIERYKGLVFDDDRRLLSNEYVSCVTKSKEDKYTRNVYRITDEFNVGRSKFFPNFESCVNFIHDYYEQAKDACF